MVVLGTQKKAAALYTQAGDYQKTARFYYKKAEDTYYQVSYLMSSQNYLVCVVHVEAFPHRKRHQ